MNRMNNTPPESRKGMVLWMDCGLTPQLELC